MLYDWIAVTVSHEYISCRCRKVAKATTTPKAVREEQLLSSFPKLETFGSKGLEKSTVRISHHLYSSSLCCTLLISSSNHWGCRNRRWWHYLDSEEGSFKACQRCLSKHFPKSAQIFESKPIPQRNTPSERRALLEARDEPFQAWGKKKFVNVWFH